MAQSDWTVSHGFDLQVATPLDLRSSFLSLSLSFSSRQLIERERESYNLSLPLCRWILQRILDTILNCFSSRLLLIPSSSRPRLHQHSLLLSKVLLPFLVLFPMNSQLPNTCVFFLIYFLFFVIVVLVLVCMPQI